MNLKSIIIAIYITSPVAFAGTLEPSALALLTAKNAQLEKANQDLDKRIKTLENERARWEAVELTAARALSSANAAQTAANTAQTSANNAQTAATKAQNSADIPHHFYGDVSFASLRSFHDGCVPQDSAGPACAAAVHRYCNSQGFVGGLVQEVGGNAYGVACFR